MTIEEFLEELKKVKKEEGFDNSNQNRLRIYIKDNYYCPITAVAQITLDKYWPTYDMWEAGNRLGLDDELIVDIFKAADKEKNYDKLLRHQMEKILK